MQKPQHTRTGLKRVEKFTPSEEKRLDNGYPKNEKAAASKAPRCS
jgi:hypothetical protein